MKESVMVKVTVKMKKKHNEVKCMKVSYKRLWKLLVDKEMSKADFHKASGLSSIVMIKLRN